MSDIELETTAVLASGSVEYSASEAAVGIHELIGMLEEMKEDGVTHVLMSSGNYRGAQWQRVSTDWSWASDES